MKKKKILIYRFIVQSFGHLNEPLPGVLGNKGKGAFIFREQGNTNLFSIICFLNFPDP